MWNCDGNGCGPLWGMWWLIPLFFMVLCFLMCRFFRRRTVGGGWPCGWRASSRTDIEALRGEIRELKEEIGKMKGKQGG